MDEPGEILGGMKGYLEEEKGNKARIRRLIEAR